MIGIYSWRNKLNNKRYIGQSIDIERRKKQHIASIGQYNTKLSQALLKYGLDNFEFTVLEETTIDNLNAREQYWIHYYDSINNGYNITDVEPEGPVVRGEFNPNTSLTDKDVLNIRTRVHIYKEPCKMVYADYKDKISYDSFWSIAHGVTWQTVDTSMIKPITTGSIGSSNGRSKLTESDVLEIRNRIYLKHEDMLDVYQDYKDRISYSAYGKAVRGDTWKNVDTSMIHYVSVKRQDRPKAKLSTEDVVKIRYEYNNNLKTLSELYKEYYYVTPATIRRIVNYETWKNI